MQETALTPSDNPQLTAQHRELLDQLLDKWSLQVLDALCGSPLRFNELRRAIPVVTQKSLTATLRRLERNGMVERIVTNTRPVAVEYRISPLGKTLQDLIDALLRWSTVTLPDVERARARFDDQVDAEQERTL
ncbi:helix-turn-helix domain-containing protein [Nocardia sp. CS682]|uniref:winged helix-turn-helix transcriptional regulator n=1 Tax=Nocardia sp. CS682 TaxID=1047172 RepID=UPI001075857D|nr:helix-turn-helix domain-containing protein [Nocardia sp. CS682]QBS42140.1 transcriptional regulator [Nocardia sp. CS682]